ncbi:MAG: hypothetical protein RR898_06850 [Clostridium sp.]|uniref:hypothetical protein n=1 Tax=Clostridium sp. TaxID=1506 RepID=UPI002FC91C22
MITILVILIGVAILMFKAGISIEYKTVVRIYVGLIILIISFVLFLGFILIPSM